MLSSKVNFFRRAAWPETFSFAQNHLYRHQPPWVHDPASTLHCSYAQTLASSLCDLHCSVTARMGTIALERGRPPATRTEEFHARHFLQSIIHNFTLPADKKTTCLMKHALSSTRSTSIACTTALLRNLSIVQKCIQVLYIWSTRRPWSRQAT